MGSITTKPDKVPASWQEYLRTIQEPPTLLEQRRQLTQGASQRLGGEMTGAASASNAGYGELRR